MTHLRNYSATYFFLSKLKSLNSKKIYVRSGIRTHAWRTRLRPERSALDHSAILTWWQRVEDRRSVYILLYYIWMNEWMNSRFSRLSLFTRICVNAQGRNHIEAYYNDINFAPPLVDVCAVQTVVFLFWLNTAPFI